MYERPINLIIVGDSGVGKTSLLDRFVENIFNEELPLPMEEVWYTKKFNENVEVRILDKFVNRFCIVQNRDYRHKHGIIIVFDVTNQESFENAKQKWYKEITRYCNLEDVAIILIGNKIDLKDSRVVEFQIAKEFAEEVNILYFETSTKHDIDVNEAFYGILRQISNDPVFSNETPQIPPINANKKSQCVCF